MALDSDRWPSLGRAPQGRRLAASEILSPQYSRKFRRFIASSSALRLYGRKRSPKPQLSETPSSGFTFIKPEECETAPRLTGRIRRLQRAKRARKLSGTPSSDAELARLVGCRRLVRRLVTSPAQLSSAQVPPRTSDLPRYSKEQRLKSSASAGEEFLGV
jgi:hypothetical protein